MRTFGFLLLSLLWTISPLQAQTIRGIVVEDSTRIPIAGVLVELVAPDEGRVAMAQTDSAGTFLLLPRRSGSFLIRLRHLAYAAVDSAALQVRSGETLEIELRMAHAAIPIEPLVVTLRRDRRVSGFYERRQRGGFGYFLARSDIETRRSPRTTDLLRTMPGLQIVPADRRLGRSPVNLITMRGALGRCLPTIYLDGVVVEQFEESGVDDWLHPDMLEGVEVYTGAASAPGPIHGLNNCGVVAFWTRSDVGGEWSWRKLAIGAGLFVLGILLGSQLTR